MPPSSAAPSSTRSLRIRTSRDPMGWLWSAISAFASFVAGAVLFRSATISLALLGLIFVHEMGHVIALWLRRIPASAPIFIPLVGAFVVPGQIRRARDMAFVALAGPFTGGLGALACLFIANTLAAPTCRAVDPGLQMVSSYPCGFYDTAAQYSWLALAHIGFLFNLVNLLPLFPLDGGRAAATISRWLWPLGILVSFALLLLDPEPLTWVLVLIAAGLTLWAFVQREPITPVEPSPSARLGIVVSYVGLALLLAAGMLFAQDRLQVLQFLRFHYYP